jgi:serine/threonine-protein kinase ATR
MLRFTRSDNRVNHPERHIASSWLATAKIARKAGQFDEAYSAILRASELDVQYAKLEHARWWWHQGHSRKAIECLHNSLDAGVFDLNRDVASTTSSNLSLDDVAKNSHNIVLGKALALLAKWLDTAKQTSEEDILNRYKRVQTICDKWEKSHYLLGHYYNRLLEHEEAKPAGRQRDQYLTGDLTRLVCQCYIRSLHFGHKYIYETLPRAFTLFLDFGANVNNVIATKEDRMQMAHARQQKLVQMNEYVEKAAKRLPVYVVLLPPNSPNLVPYRSCTTDLASYASE